MKENLLLLKDLLEPYRIVMFQKANSYVTKGYVPNWSEEVFVKKSYKITKVKNTLL